MHHDGASLAALIGSRICHDLINPIGAISNGLELVGMGGTHPDGPEMTLIQQSCDNATARIRFFRIAFGSAGDIRPVAAAEAQRTLAEHYAGTRILTDWTVTDALARNATQLAYLSVLCLETALPLGGQIRVALSDGHLVTRAEADRIREDAPLWSLLTGRDDAPPPELRPADVQFALLSQLCADDAIDARFFIGTDHAHLTLGLAHQHR